MFSDPHESTALKRALQSEVAIFTSRAYADNTNRAYRTHRRSYLAFCTYMGYNPVPATSEVVCHYAAFLARSLSFSSIKQYLNIIRILHSEWNMPNPTLDNYNLQCVLKGSKRTLGAPISRKAAITPRMLVLMLAHLNLNRLEDCAIWAAMLMIYYGMLRVASVLCGGHTCNHTRHVTLGDIPWKPEGLDVTVRHTKTIQFQERTLVIPLPRVPGSILCPAQAMALYLQRANVTQHVPGPLFLCDPTPDGRALTSPIFNRRVKSLLQAAGLPADQLAGHSFRRGGATLAYAAGIPVDTIRIVGDWASNAYTAYILPQRNHVSQAIRRMADDATDQCRHQV